MYLRYHRRLSHYFRLTGRSAQNGRVTPNKYKFSEKLTNVDSIFFISFPKNLLYKELELVYYAWIRFAGGAYSPAHLISLGAQSTYVELQNSVSDF